MNAKAKIAIVLLIIAGVGYGLVVWLDKSHSDASSITKTVDVSKLDTNRLIKMLSSGDFKKIIQARKEISKLDIKKRLYVLEEMAKAKDSAVRMMAVTELGKLKNNKNAINILKRLASDKDKDVAEEAKKTLEGKE